MTKKEKLIFLGLIFFLSLFSAIMIFFPMGDYLPQNQKLPVSKSLLAIINFLIVFIVYGGLGYAGLILSKKIPIPSLLDKSISNKDRFLSPFLFGIISGVVLIIGDKIFSSFHTLGKIPHPPFPASVIASFSAGIGEELIFRLFFISFWMWILSFIVKKKKNILFWIVGSFSALLFSAGHLPSVMLLFHFTTIQQIPTVLILEVFFLNSLVALVATYHFKKAGYLSAIGVHFWADIVWHVIYGLTGGLL